MHLVREKLHTSDASLTHLNQGSHQEHRFTAHQRRHADSVPGYPEAQNSHTPSQQRTPPHPLRASGAHVHGTAGPQPAREPVCRLPSGAQIFGIHQTSQSRSGPAIPQDDTATERPPAPFCRQAPMVPPATWISPQRRVRPHHFFSSSDPSSDWRSGLPSSVRTKSLGRWSKRPSRYPNSSSGISRPASTALSSSSIASLTA